ncbi:LysR family transcriptional regulator [Rhodovibrionaceae bacterium A322]
MEFHQIKYFLAVAETLNFTRAAERCHVSQPALTRAIKKLEEELGGLLFQRQHSKTHLTELGRVMREHLGRVEASSQEALVAARQTVSLEKAPLTLGIMCTIGSTRTIPFLSRFHAQHPGIELTLQDVTPTNVTELLLAGELDCALLGLPTPLDGQFETVKLYDEQMVAIFPPDHRFAARETVPVVELNGERYLDRLHCEFRSSFTSLMEEQEIDVLVPYSSEREDWIQSMVLQGLGVCMMPEHSVTLAALETRPVSDPEIRRSVELVTVAGHQKTPAVQTFIEEATAFGWQN